MVAKFSDSSQKLTHYEEDSGYVSMDSSKNEIILFESPDKKMPTIKLTVCDDDDDDDVDASANISTIENFDEPSCSSSHLSPIQSKECFRSLSLSTPYLQYHPVPGRIDLLSALGQSFPHIISKILKCLEPDELCILSSVSHSCREIVLNDHDGKKRREKHLAAMEKLKQEVGQENWPIKKTSPEVRSEHRGALSEVRNTQGPPTRNDTPLDPSVSTVRSIVNSHSNTIGTANTNANSNSSANGEPTPIIRLKRRRIEEPESVSKVISSTPKIPPNRRISTDKDLDSDSGIFEETSTSKVKTKSRKNDPAAGSKASKRHLKRL